LKREGKKKMDKVRCKFVVDSVTKSRSGFANVVMTPVTSGSEENKKFWEYTPSGKLEIGTTNIAAADELEVGKEYYIDITKAE
jgi:hypothetical protein